MPFAVSDSVKRRAANKVLAGLGSEMLAVLEHHFRRSYAISLDPNDSSKFSLDQLHFALSVLLGEHHANVLLSQMTKEIEQLATEQTH